MLRAKVNTSTKEMEHYRISATGDGAGEERYDVKEKNEKEPEQGEMI